MPGVIRAKTPPADPGQTEIQNEMDNLVGLGERRLPNIAERAVHEHEQGDPVADPHPPTR